MEGELPGSLEPRRRPPCPRDDIDGVEIALSSGTASVRVLLAPCEDGETTADQQARDCDALRHLSGWKRDDRPAPYGFHPVRDGDRRGFLRLVEAGRIGFVSAGGSGVRLSRIRYSASDPEAVDGYSSDGARVKFGGEEHAVPKLRRLDVALPAERLVGRWEYRRESDRAGEAIYRSYRLELRADGRFEDELFEFHRSDVEWNPLFDDPEPNFLPLDRIRRTNGRGSGKYVTGKGYHELRYEGGARVRVPRLLEGDVLTVETTPCRRK